MKKEDLVLCGLPAVKARFARDAASVERLYFDYATGRRIGVMCKALAQAKKVYRCVEPAELEKISGTMHHGGIVAVVRGAATRGPADGDIAAWARRGAPLLVLDRIGNAHNLGAIARTAAFFGVPVLVISDDPEAARPNTAAHRVAEGGFESLEVRSVRDMPGFLKALAGAGYEVVGAAAVGGRMTEGGGRKPVALVLGNEERGLAPDVAKACTRLVTIPGSGSVESLNVSVAAGVLMWQLLK